MRRRLAIAFAALAAVALSLVLVLEIRESRRASQRASAGNGPTAGPIATTDGFYVDPQSNPAIWVGRNPDDPRADRIHSAVANVPMARWFGDWSGAIGTAVGSHVDAAHSAGKLPVLVAYNIPERDACGGHSGGGSVSPAAYRTWISEFAAAVGDRPAIVILEPDAFGDHQCMQPAAIAVRNQLLTFATEQFRARSANAWAYLDGGNASWVSADVMAERLDEAGLRNVHGFSVNVSNYYATAESVAYAQRVNAGLSGRGYTKPFVVDTSRNGNGASGEWCNPAGRRLGTHTQAGGGAELLLWVKVPGDSDGRCGIAPGVEAGTFSPDLAIRLIDGV